MSVGKELKNLLWYQININSVTKGKQPILNLEN